MAEGKPEDEVARADRPVRELASLGHKEPRGSRLVWSWATRICAIGGFGYLIAFKQLEAGTSYYVLLTGLFFGSEVVSGQFRFFKKDEA